MKTASWYDYSQVVYVNKTTPVIIGCPIHGYFKQNPFRHMRGAKCPYCSGNYRFNPKNKEETKKYWIENGITGETSWYKHWRDNSLYSLGYPYNPWASYKMSRSKWTDYVFGKKKTKEETKEYWIKNKITGSYVWRKHWKGNNLHEQGYINQPWKFFKMTCIEWTVYVWGKKE